MRIFSVAALFVLFSLIASAQNDSSAIAKKKTDQNRTAPIDSSKQRDMIDVVSGVFNSHSSPDKRAKAKKILVSVVPSAGYSLSTGFAVDLSGNIAFYTHAVPNETISFVNFQTFFDSNKQKTFFSQANIWGKDNATELVTDVRLYKYPNSTFGLGSFTTNADEDPIDYDYLRVYATELKRLSGYIYLGFGYNFDYHYNITETGIAGKTTTPYDQYGFASSSTSSGVNLTFLYDSRTSGINALGGYYANLVFRQNTTLLGGNTNWESLQLDTRKYFRVSPNNNNILAFWGMAWFTFNGKVPYNDLPSTGWDTFNNLGRGYVIGRFRGQDLLYLESEFRYGITKNGLLGGVVFANGQSFSEYPSGDFKRIDPSVGTGLRLKINKHSNTNVCLDYAYGLGNSNGFFVNLGEVF